MATKTKSRRTSKQKINASKERARECREHLKWILADYAQHGLSLAETERRHFDEIEQFLDAAEKKLPTEDAYAREAQRRKGR